MGDPIKRRKLFDALVASGEVTVSFEEFSNGYSDPSRQLKLYNVLKSDGRLTVGFEEFADGYFSDLSEPVSAPQPKESLQVKSPEPKGVQAGADTGSPSASANGNSSSGFKKIELPEFEGSHMGMTQDRLNLERNLKVVSRDIRDMNLDADEWNNIIHKADIDKGISALDVITDDDEIYNKVISSSIPVSEETLSSVDNTFGDLRKYGIDTNFFGGLIERTEDDIVLKPDQFDSALMSDDNVRLLQEQSKKNAVIKYANERADYLHRHVRILKQRKDKNLSYDKDKLKDYEEELNLLDVNIDNYLKNELPFITAREREAWGKESDKYYEAIRNDKDYSQSRVFSEFGRGMLQPIQDMAITVAGIFGGDVAEEKERLITQVQRADDVSTSVGISGEGNVSIVNGRKYIVLHNGQILDAEQEVDVTRLLTNEDRQKVLDNVTEERDSFVNLVGMINATSNVLGNLAVQIAAARGVSNTLSFIPNAHRVSAMGTSGMISYTSTYNSTYEQLVASGVNRNEAAELANEGGLAMGAVTGITSLFAPNTVGQKAFSNKLVNDAINAYRSGGKKAFQSSIKSSANNYIREGFPEIGQEIVQELTELNFSKYNNQQINRELGEDILDTDITNKELIETIAYTGLATGISTIPASIQYNSKLNTYKKASKHFDKFSKGVDENVRQGFITSEEGAKLKSEVEKFGKHYYKIPNEIGENRLNKENIFEVINLLDEIDQLETKKKNSSNIFHEQFNKEIAAKKKELDQFYNEGSDNIINTDNDTDTNIDNNTDNDTGAPINPFNDAESPITPFTGIESPTGDSGASTSNNQRSNRAVEPIKKKNTFVDKVKNGVWGMLTGENPNAQQLSPEENIKLNQEAKNWLEGKGYTVREIKGKYGNEENSFFVEDLSYADAVEFARTFNQESVATSGGLVYQDGSFYPRKEGVDHGGNYSDLYSTVETEEGSLNFKVDYDWSTKVQADGSRIKAEESVDNSVSDVVNTDTVVTHEGREGRLYSDEGGKVIFESIDGDYVVDLGNETEINNTNISDLGLTQAKTNQIEVSNDNKTVTFNGETYHNQYSNPESAISYDGKGNRIVSLETESGQKRTFRGKRADDIAYSILSKKLEQEATVEQLKKIEDEANRRTKETTETTTTTENETSTQQVEQGRTNQDNGKTLNEEVEGEQNNEESNNKKVEEENSTSRETREDTSDSGTVQNDTKKELEKQKSKLKETWKKWLDSKQNMGIMYDPKSDAELDVELTKAFAKYLRALGANTITEIKRAIENFTDGRVVLDNEKADVLREMVFQDKKRAEKIVKKKTVKTKKKTKAIVRESTGQKDTSKKVTTSEAKLLKEKFKNLQRGYKTGSSEVKKLKSEFIKEVKKAVKGLSREATVPQMRSMMNKIDKVNEKNIDEIRVELDKLIKEIRKNKRRKAVSSLKSKVKKHGKSKSKLHPQNLKEVAKAAMRVDERYLSDKEYDRYVSLLYDINKSFAPANAFDYRMIDADNTMERLQELEETSDNNRLNEQIEEKGGKKDGKEDETRDTLLSIADDQLNNLDFHLKTQGTPVDLTVAERRILDKLLKVKLHTLETDNIKKFIKAVDNIIRNGDLSNTGEIISDINGTQISEELSTSVGGKILRVNKNIIGKFKDFVLNNKVEATSDVLFKKVENLMLQHIDSAINSMKGTTLYELVIHPISSKNEIIRKETARVSERLTKQIHEAKAARQGNRGKRLFGEVKRGLGFSNDNFEYKFNVLLQMYFRQKEYESNKEAQGKKVFSFREHLEAMKKEPKNTTLADPNTEMKFIEDLFEEFKGDDGEVSLEKLDNYFNDAEKKVISIIDEELRTTKEKSSHVNNNYKNQGLSYLENYFPRKVGKAIKGNNDIDDADARLNRMYNALGIKAGSSNERSSTKAQPLDFNTLDIFVQHVQGVNTEYHLTENLMNMNNAVKKLVRAGDNQAELAKLLHKTVGDMLQLSIGSHSMERTSTAGKLFNSLKRKTFNKILIDPLKMIGWDIPSNWGVIGLANSYRAGKIMKVNKLISNDALVDISNSIGSVHIERFGSRSVDFKETMHSTISKSKYKKLNPTFTDNLLDFFNKNKVGDIADAASDMYYKAVDLPLMYLHKVELFDEFKKLTGKEITNDNYKDLLGQYEPEFTKALARADKKISNVFNTAATSEQKLTVQSAPPSSWKKFADSFMRSFAFNENSVFWSSFKNMLGLEQTMSKEEAWRNFVIVNLRSVSYAYLSSIVMDMILPEIFGEAPDDEEMEEINEKALGRALAQHGMLVALGQKGNLVNAGAAFAIESLRRVYYKSEGEKYDMYQDALLYAAPNRGSITQYASLLGAEGEVIKTGLQSFDFTLGLIEKWATDEEITEEDVINGKAIQLYFNVVSQSTGLGINRLGKIIGNNMKKEEERTKKKKAERKKADKKNKGKPKSYFD